MYLECTNPDRTYLESTYPDRILDARIYRAWNRYVCGPGLYGLAMYFPDIEYGLDFYNPGLYALRRQRL